MISEDKRVRLHSILASKGIKLAYQVRPDFRKAPRSRGKMNIAVLLDTPAKSSEEMMALRVDLTAEMVHLLHEDEIGISILDNAPPAFRQQTVRTGRLLFDPENRHPDYYVKNFTTPGPVDKHKAKIR